MDGKPTAGDTIAPTEATVLELIANDQALPRVLDSVAALVAARRSDLGCAAFLVDRTGKQLELAGTADLPAWFARATVPLGEVGGAIGLAADRSESFRGAGPQPESDTEAVLAGLGRSLVAAVPIALPGDELAAGSLAVFGADPIGDDALFVEVVGHLAGLAVATAERRRAAVRPSIDPISGALDRRATHDHLERAVARARREQSKLAVLYCSIPGPPGSRRSAATLLQSTLRPNDAVGHVGGEDFVAICEHVRSITDAATIGRRVGRALDAGIPKVGDGAAIGVAVSDPSLDPEDLLRRADEARDLATSSQDRVVVADLPGQPVEARTYAEVLRAAIGAGEIVPWFQPVVDLRTLEIVGVEALARWIGSDGMAIAPGEFIPTVEEQGLMPQLTAEILFTAVSPSLRRGRSMVSSTTNSRLPSTSR